MALLSKPISVSQKRRLQSELDARQGKAKQRLLTAEQIALAAEAAESTLARCQIPKSLRGGATVVITGGTIDAKKYRYRYETTVVRLQRRATAWFVLELGREQYWPGSGPDDAVKTTPLQRECIADNHRHVPIAF